MNIHEYQGKAVLKSFGAPVPRSFPAFTAEEAVDAAAKLGGSVWAVKSQIHAGGRGKGKFKEANAGEKGGVRIAFKPEDVGLYAQQMLNHTLVTEQTGPAPKIMLREGKYLLIARYGDMWGSEKLNVTAGEVASVKVKLKDKLDAYPVIAAE